MGSSFPDSWQLLPLEDCMAAIIDYRGKTPKKTLSGVPLVTAKVVKDGRIQPIQEYIAHEDYDDWMRRGFPEPGDVLMTTEAPLGEIAQLDDRKVALAQRLITLRGKKSLLDNNYLKFLMQSEFVQHQLAARATGTTVLGIKQSELRQISLVIPPLDEQKQIAHILGTLDDKIELNQQMNRTLEGITRALFKSWFIDFDPVRAKLEGRQPTGMNAETAALFPDSFEDSPLGKIPKSWRVGKLEDIAEVVMGASPKGDTYNEEGIGIPLVNGPVEFGDHFLIKRKWTTAPTRLSQAGDLIFCVRGSTTGRRVIADDVFCLGRGVCAFRSRSGKQSFINQIVNLEINRLLAKTTGSVFPNLGSKDIKEFQVLVPQEPIVKRYCTICSNLDGKIYSQVRESIALSSMRDSLLPKLLSGEIRVNDAEQALEAVA
jgi:type I restriction enzyme S subunit